MNKFKVGDTVEGPHGVGEIIGVDLPLSNNKRYIVRLDTPHFDTNPCYFPKDLTLKRRDYIVSLKSIENLSDDDFMINEAISVIGRVTLDFVCQMLGKSLNEIDLSNAVIYNQ